MFLYEYSCMFGTFLIECEILKDDDPNSYTISFIDPISEEIREKMVERKKVTFEPRPVL